MKVPEESEFMKIREFRLESYFDKYEFSAPYLLAQSDCETMSTDELLSLEPGTKELLLNSRLGYTEVSGSPELRQLASSLYSSVSEDEILMHTGAEEAVFCFMNVLLNRGDHIITMFPAYQSLYEIALSIGCTVSNWELRALDGRWAADFDELENLIRPETRLIAVNSPNNPTGYTFSENEIRKLCAIARKHGIFIFADEVYRGLDTDGLNRPWIADVYEKAVSLGVLSKAYGLAGLRTGWTASHDRNILSEMKNYKTYLSICSSVPSEILACAALKNSGMLLERNNKILRDNLRTADRFFEAHKDIFTYMRPQCGPVGFHRINSGVQSDVFCTQLADKAGILLLPSSVYEYDDSYFRMGFGRLSFAENIKRLEEYLTDGKYI